MGPLSCQRSRGGGCSWVVISSASALRRDFLGEEWMEWRFEVMSLMVAGGERRVV